MPVTNTFSNLTSCIPSHSLQFITASSRNHNHELPSRYKTNCIKSTLSKIFLLISLKFYTLVYNSQSFKSEITVFNVFQVAENKALH